MDIFRHLVALQPEDVDSRLEVGFAHNNLGKLKTSLGLLDEAERHFYSDLSVKQQVVEENPNHNLWREYLAASHFWLGKLLSSRGSLIQSNDQAEAALEILDSLVEIDQTMMPWLQRRAAVQSLLAANCRMTGNLDCAAKHIATALADLGKLTTTNPDNAQWQRDQNFSRLEAAWQAASLGEMDRAAKLSESVIKETESLNQQVTVNRETRKLMVMALLTLGDISQQTSQFKAAADSWQTALSMLEAHLDSSRNPEVIDLHSKLLIRHGNLTEAQQAIEKLEQMKYFSQYPQRLTYK
jgi:tetratricopeptide (TPR) repeat protein